MGFDLNDAEIPPPPKSDEVEFTFFGPGFGESIVVHIPGIGWGVIDSCQFGSANERFIPPLEYLISQGVDSLAFLILTHPHSDHFNGMDQIVDHYLGRIQRVCRYAGEGAKELAEYLVRRGVKGRPGAVSLSAVFKALIRRCSHHSRGWTTALPGPGQILLHRLPAIHVFSLSTSFTLLIYCLICCPIHVACISGNVIMISPAVKSKDNSAAKDSSSA